MEDYSEIFACFSDPSVISNPVINQLNLTLDHNGIIRVKGECEKLKHLKRERFPILIHKKSKLAHLLINEHHYILGHADIYKVFVFK